MGCNKLFFKKLNSHTHIKIHSQVLRAFLMIFFTAVVVLTFSVCSENKMKKNNESLSTSVANMEEYTDQFRNEYKVILELNHEQENTISKLEEQVSRLESENYKLTHPKDKTYCDEDDFEWLVKTVQQEAGCEDCTDEHQKLVCAVILNRMRSGNYPDTIQGVISQKNAYGCYNTWDWYNDYIEDRVYKNVLSVINGEFYYPDNIVYQASFPQKDYEDSDYRIYKKFYTPSTGITTYFCMGE